MAHGAVGAGGIVLRGHGIALGRFLTRVALDTVAIGDTARQAIVRRGPLAARSLFALEQAIGPYSTAPEPGPALRLPVRMAEMATRRMLIVRPRSQAVRLRSQIALVRRHRARISQLRRVLNIQTPLLRDDLSRTVRDRQVVRSNRIPFNGLHRKSPRLKIGPLAILDKNGPRKQHHSSNKTNHAAFGGITLSRSRDRQWQC